MRSPDLRKLVATCFEPSLRGLFDIPTHLTTREKLELHRLARTVARRRHGSVHIAEVGAYLGASTAFLAAGVAGTGSRVTSIDTWNNDAMSEGTRDTMHAFLANTHRFRDTIVAVRGWSTDPAVVATVSASGSPIDLLFIDGDHSHEAVLADWRTYRPLLARHAFVVMHDVGWAEGVQRVVAERIAPHARATKRLSNLWWGELHT